MRLRIACRILLMFILGVLTPGNHLLSQDADYYLKISDSIYYSNPDSSFSLAKKAEEEAIKTKDSSFLARALVNQGRFW